MLQKLKVTLSIFSFSFVLAVVGSAGIVSADNLTVAFACSDKSTAVSIKTGSNHEEVVTCQSGAKILYENYDGYPLTAVAVTCPTGETVGDSVDTPNQPTSKYAFYCEILEGHDDPVHTRTNHTPTAKVTTPPDACGGGAADCSAPTPDPAATSGKCAKAETCDLVKNYINPLINFLAALVGLAVTIAIIYGGIEYASAGGDSQKVSIAKNRIRNAIIALITFFFLYAILNFLIPGGLF